MAYSADKITSDVLRTMLERATVSAWLIDADGTIVFTNAAAAELTGYTLQELLGSSIGMLMDKEIGASHTQYIRSYIDRGADSTVLGRVREFDLVRKDGSTVPIELEAFEMPTAKGGAHLFGAFISDNTRHKHVETEMARIAREDYLTGYLNRLGFMERARQELSRARRNNASLSLIVMDIDRFKRINDTHGHQGGDAVLADLLPALADVLRAHDVFGRVGGEEFFILLPEARLDEATIVAERLRNALENHAFLCNGRRVPVTASLGCATLSADDDLDRLIQRADRRMYLAKNAGRNCVVAADDVPAREASRRHAGSRNDRST